MNFINIKIIKNKFRYARLRIILLSLFTLFLIDSPVIAAQFGPDSLVEFSRAPVVVDGYDLFYVRGISSYPADERAKVIKGRIEDIAADHSIPANSVNILESELQDDIFVSNKFVMSVFDSDAKIEGVRREVLSLTIKRNIIKAIYLYRYERSSEALLSKAFFAIGATIITLILLLLFRWGIKKLHLFLESKLKTKIENLETRSFQLIRSNQLWYTFYNLSKTIKFLLTLIIVFIYAQYLFGLFPWTRSVSNSLLGFFLTPLSSFAISILNFIPNLAFLFVIYLVTRYLLKLIKLFFNGIELGNINIKGFEAEWSLPTFKIFRIFVLMFAIIIAYPYIPGSDSDAFKGVSLFLGLLISLGSSSIIGNLIAGYAMIYRRTFRKGDLVKIDNYIGQVVETKLFITKLRTPKNEEIIIPNSVILSTNVVNYSSLANEHGLVLYTNVGIGYETSWRQVEEMLKEAASRTEGALKDPPPFVLQKLLGDFAVTYELNVYCNVPHSMMKIYTALHQNILDVFNENNVQIMTPAYEGDPHEPKVVPKEKWHMPLALKISRGDIK